MKTVSLCAALAAALSTAGCSPTLAGPTGVPSSDPPPPGASVEPVEPGPPPSADVQELARDDNQFAADLYARLRNEPGNLVVSPASISAAIAMTYAGARGETAEQMRRTMHYQLEAERLHAAYGETLRHYNGSGAPRGYQLAVANRLFGQQGHPLLPGFLQVTKGLYGAELEQLDFAGASETSRLHINRWVAGRTEQKIQDLLPEGSIESATRLVLANAVWFKGRWASAFEKEQTRAARFTLADGAEVSVPTMQQHGGFAYAELDGLKVLELPYQGGDLAMTIVLPERADGLPALERRMDAQNLDRWIGSAQPTQLQVRLPRFKISPARPLALADTLRSMGMQLAFTEGQADFSGMNGKRDLYIRHVFHKAFVEVNEEGTEAAAATAVVVNREATAMPASFSADHPFAFVIRDTRSGRILFQGRVADPRG